MTSENLSQSNPILHRFQSKLYSLDRNLIFLFLLPLLLFPIKYYWAYIDVDQIDPWIYLGFSLDLKQHLITFNGTYYATRLPWILPGFVFYKFFSPLVAYYLFHLLYYYVSLFSFYFLSKHFVDRTIALIASLLLGCNYIFVYALASHYMDGGGITYLLLTLLALTQASKNNSSTWLIFAGAFYGCLIYTQLFLISYTPLLILYFLMINRPCQGKAIFQNFGLIFFGFVALTLFLCSVHYLLTHKFFFFMPILNWTTQFVSGPNPWLKPIATWWFKAHWLVMPALTCLGSAGMCIYFRFRKALLEQRHHFLILQVFFIATLGIHVIWELVIGHPVLELYNYMSYTLPVMYLALATQLTILFHNVELRRICSVLITSIVVTIPFYFTLKSSMELHVLKHPMIAVPFVLAAIGLLSIYARSRYFKQIVPYLIFPSFAAIYVYGAFSTSFDRDPMQFDRHKKIDFLAVIEAIDIAKNFDQKKQARYWYDHKSPLGGVFRAVASTNLWGYRLINEEFPKTQNALGFVLPQLHDKIIIFSDDESAFQKANQNLAQLGFKGEYIESKPIHVNGINFNMTLFNICSLDENPQNSLTN